MSGKLKMIVIAGAGAASFGAAMAIAVFTAKPLPPRAHADANGQHATTMAAAEAEVPEGRALPQQRQMEDLIRELQLRIAEYKQKEQSLVERESRLTLAQDLLRKQSKELETQLVRLLAQQTNLGKEQEKLDKSRVRIVQEEKANLKKTAAIYEKMDSASGGKILVGLVDNQQTEDAVAILHYMSERSAAKVLAEITDKALAARLTEMLKRVREEG
jgi:flagellar motility protein MotE (MotC chaperone)